MIAGDRSSWDSYSPISRPSQATTQSPNATSSTPYGSPPVVEKPRHICCSCSPLPFTIDFGESEKASRHGVASLFGCCHSNRHSDSQTYSPPPSSCEGRKGSRETPSALASWWAKRDAQPDRTRGHLATGRSDRPGNAGTLPSPAPLSILRFRRTLDALRPPALGSRPCLPRTPMPLGWASIAVPNRRRRDLPGSPDRGSGHFGQSREYFDAGGHARLLCRSGREVPEARIHVWSSEQVHRWLSLPRL